MSENNVAPPYPCIGTENVGGVNLIGADGVVFNKIEASRCFCDWYMLVLNNGTTWSWVNGVDPDDPTTWPDYEPPVDPPVDPEEPPVDPETPTDPEEPPVDPDPETPQQ